jgi:hypothetical protein
MTRRRLVIMPGRGWTGRSSRSDWSTGRGQPCSWRTQLVSVRLTTREPSVRRTRAETTVCGSAYRCCRWGSGFRGPARESGPFSWRGDATQAGSDVEDDNPLGGRADRLGDRAVIRVVERGVTRLRRGEGDDEAVVVAVHQPLWAGGVPSTTASTRGLCRRSLERTAGRAPRRGSASRSSRTPARHG